MTTQNEIRTRPQSSTRTIFTGQDVNGLILIQDPPYDGRGVIDLTCELVSCTQRTKFIANTGRIQISQCCRQT